MSLKLFGIQFGQSGTATNNLTAAVPSPGDGTWKLARGNFGATTQDIITVDATGAVTAEITPASTDNSKKIVNTAWAKLGFAVMKGLPGYIKFPDWMGGLIFQWGNVTSPNGTGSASFPLVFPTTLLAAFSTMNTGLSAGLMWTGTVTASSNSSISITRRYMASGGGPAADAGESAWWFVIGY